MGKQVTLYGAVWPNGDYGVYNDREDRADMIQTLRRHGPPQLFTVLVDVPDYRSPEVVEAEVKEADDA